RLDLKAGEFFLVTMHRAENVDEPARLGQLLEGLRRIEAQYQQPVIVSLHPRTKDKLERFGLEVQSPNIRLCAPFGFFDFVHLEKMARCVISDSGTVQEECSIF